MTMVQMNVRIDAKLKNEVEEVLKGKGVSVSDVIRSLWLYIADRKEVPALETTAEEQARDGRQRQQHGDQHTCFHRDSPFPNAT